VYHYDPSQALEELEEDSILANPVYIRDMIVRARLSPDQALDLNRSFLQYQKEFSLACNTLRPILAKLASIDKS